MDDLGIDVMPAVDEETIRRMKCMGIYDHLPRVVEIPFEPDELYELLKMLENVAVGAEHYSQVSDVVVMAEKIRHRWKARDAHPARRGRRKVSDAKTEEGSNGNGRR